MHGAIWTGLRVTGVALQQNRRWREGELVIEVRRAVESGDRQRTLRTISNQILLG